MVHAIAPTVSLVFHAWEYSYVRHCPQEGVDGVSALRCATVMGGEAMT